MSPQFQSPGYVAAISIAGLQGCLFLKIPMRFIAPPPTIGLSSTPPPGSIAAAIALGSNLPSNWGAPLQTLTAALGVLAQMPGIGVTGLSSFYQTEPIGPAQPDYLNACATVVTTRDPDDLLGILHQIEDQFGRVRRERWGPRTLDLDLLLYGDRILDTATIRLPHPGLADRDFVLVPLTEIAGDWWDPRSGRSIQGLADALKYRDETKL
jgi:2-amino-4-hydroxy-6-hydroxymethyldihydropteridine diphosphokinase